MNCKQGDLARIVGLGHATTDGNDRFVTCVAPARSAGWVGWVFDKEVVVTLSAPAIVEGRYFMPGTKVSLRALADEYLRPIRDPGDDARDEMLRPLPTEVAHG